MRNRLTRRSFMKTSAAASTVYSLVPHTVLGANERVNIGVIGTGGKGSDSCKRFENVIAVSDPDTKHMEGKPGAKCRDMRELLDMKEVDAVYIATPNHWHSLAAIWACQAGKHVYVEKPVSHNIWEGRQMCEARKKYKRVVQAGTQQLSCPAVQACGRDLRAGKYGKVKWIHCFKFDVRPSAGKRSEPMNIPEHIDYNLWAGPAPKDPVFRQNFHYDWHWDLRWGDGNMGNWVSHYAGDICYMLGWDRMPDSVMAAGGRFIHNDAGTAPNMLFAMMEHDGIPLTMENRDLSRLKDSKSAAVYRERRQGNIIMCEEAVIKIARGGGKAYSLKNDGTAGEMVEQYKGNGGRGHRQNFIEAIKSGDHDSLNAPIELGHVSSGMCHMPTISYRLGKVSEPDEIRARMDEYDDIKQTVEEQLKQLDILGADLSKLALGPKLKFDPKKEKFVGDHAEAANKLVRPEFRKGFEVPEKV